MRGTFALVGAFLLACNVCLADYKTNHEIEKSFVKLTDYLDSKLPNNDDAQANLKLVNSHTDGNLFKKASRAENLFKTIANLGECNLALFEAIKTVQHTTQAQYPTTTRRADKVLRTFIDAALNKCDSYHEQALKEALSKMSQSDRNQVESIFDAEFIQAYKDKRLTAATPHRLGFSYRTTKFWWEQIRDLARALLVAAKDDPNNTITIRADPKNERPRVVHMNQVEYVSKKYIIDACDAYYEATNAIFSYGKAASEFLKGGDSEFLAKRSEDYKNGLFRRHFCKYLTTETKSYLRDALYDYENRV